MRALIAVDSPELAQLLTDCVSQLQLEPVLATDLPAALKQFAEQRPQLVLASCSPGGIDGLALCRELRKLDLRRRAIIEIVAPGATAADLQAILDAGADDYLVDLENPVGLQLRLLIAVQRMQNRANSSQIEQQLRESVERFDLAVRGANEGLWDALPRGKPWQDPNTEVWYSPRCKELLGFLDDEFPNVLASWETRLHPEDRDRVIQALRDHIERKVPYDIEYRLRIKSGEYRWFSRAGKQFGTNKGKWCAWPARCATPHKPANTPLN